MLRALAHRRHSLGWYTASAGGDERYGVVPVLDDGDASAPSSIALKAAAKKPVGSGDSIAPDSDKNSCRRPTRRTTCRHRAVRIAVGDRLLALVTAGILSIFLVYYTNRSPKNKFEWFLNSQKFGPRFLMAVVGKIILGQWKRLERGM
jgi:hypothetical protein